MFNPNVNDIYRYISLKEQTQELAIRITNACEKFTYLHTTYKSTFQSWDFNDRKSLIIIYYKNEKDECLQLVCSFDEILPFMNNSDVQIK